MLAIPLALALTLASSGAMLDGGLATDAGSSVDDASTALRADLRARAKHVGVDGWAVLGERGWYFWAFELEHYANGVFWGPAAAAVSRAPKGQQDPLSALIAYDAMLKSVGVKLIVLPIPGKVLVYGDELKPPIESQPLEATRSAFFAALGAAGIQVIDLLPEMKAIKAAGHLAYLPRDTHWSPESMHGAAELLGTTIRAESWYRRPDPWPAVEVKPVSELVLFDLSERYRLETLFKTPSMAPLDVLQVKLNGKHVESDRHSPVVLVGDSYSVVFNSLLGHHGSLADHLAAELGFPVDQVGLAGDGALATSWGTLARRRDNLAGKKVVIMAFAERNFSVDGVGWPVIPVVRAKTSR